MILMRLEQLPLKISQKTNFPRKTFGLLKLAVLKGKSFFNNSGLCLSKWYAHESFAFNFLNDRKTISNRLPFYIQNIKIHLQILNILPQIKPSSPRS